MEKVLYLLIVGSRSIANYNQVGPVLDDLIKDLSYDKYVVVSGGASGVDYLAELWAEKHGYEKVIFKADWKKYGKSKGTAHNFELSEKYKNPLVKYQIEVFNSFE